jgi:HEPN domain-containing protein
MKTTIEWLYNELSKNNTSTDSAIEKINKESSIWEQAKELEKEQIKNAYNDGYFGDAYKYKDWEEYYNQTYNQDRIKISETKRSIEGIGLNNQNK